MTNLLVPGLHRRPVAPARAAGRLSRGDVPVFLGYARRGPVGLPVRVESLTAVEQLFGAPPAVGHLHQCLKGFFETGGRTAYVLRVAEAHARSASVELRDRATGHGVWTARAGFPWSAVDPRTQGRAPRPDEAGWVQVVEQVFRTEGSRSPAPGAWANGYAVRVRAAHRARTRTVPGLMADPRLLQLESLAGVERSSVLRLTQVRSIDGGTGAKRTQSLTTTVVPVSLDAARRTIELPDRIDGTPVLAPPGSGRGPGTLDPELPVQVLSVEFDVDVLADGRLEQSFLALSPHPGHSASLAGETAGAVSVSLVPDTGDHDWADPATWPTEGVFDLSGGTDGLAAVAAEDYLAVLPWIATLEEVALICAPDLVLADQVPSLADELPPERVDCSDLRPVAPGRLSAQVVAVDADGVEQPLAGVDVDVTGPGGRAVTGPGGVFVVGGVPLGLATVRLSKDGYEPAEVVVQAQEYLPTRPVTLSMVPLTPPRALHPEEVLDVLGALADPGRVGPHKVVVADPPHPAATFDELRTWRSRLGDSERTALYVPWLLLPPRDPGGPLEPCPASGHVCGAFAAGELALGVHRTGANLPLRHVQAVTAPLGDAEQAVANPVGINLVRAFPGRGVRAYGNRTLSSDPARAHVTTRRVVDALEKSLVRALQWMVFEPNDAMTRHAVAQTATTLLARAWRDGVLAGSSAAQAYAVTCDLSNNPEQSRAAGGLVVDVAVAPSLPYEFVLFRLGTAHDAVGVTEVSP